MPTTIEEIRSFNRFYTRRIGLLDAGLSNSPFPLVEARVLYELARGDAETAADLSRSLDMDKAHLSRVLSRLRTRGLVAAIVSPRHAKHRLLSLTASGRAAFAELEKGTKAQVDALIAPLDRAAANRLTSAMRNIKSILDRPTDSDKGAFLLRAPRVGDLGWVIHRQAALYAEEYGWDWTFEGLIAGILSQFIANFDPAREAAWIAERGDAIVGSIFLVRGDEPSTAKLRLLYVEPAARGLGIGAALVAACIERARKNGYARLVLWTNDVLVSARRIYEAAGFRLIAEEKHHSFGHDLIGQNWALDLGGA
ncbi:MAG TPA: helix-turn-helix domain-containing GNAT family N-acetyltransferase [Roseiarcus sp.]|nr:helix-turn-helix domain-containing GNAT family N-acetyltransferase [Roseiarcus sp.]